MVEYENAILCGEESGWLSMTGQGAKIRCQRSVTGCVTMFAYSGKSCAILEIKKAGEGYGGPRKGDCGLRLQATDSQRHVLTVHSQLAPVQLSAITQ